MTSQAFDLALWVPSTPPQAGNAIRATTGGSPPVTDWFPIAAGGPPGPAGPTGTPGAPGAPGPAGPQGALDPNSIVDAGNY